MTAFLLDLSVAAGAAITFGLLWWKARGEARFWAARADYWHDTSCWWRSEYRRVEYGDWPAKYGDRPTNPLNKRCIRVASIDELIARSKHVEEA